MPDAELESGSSSTFEDMTSQNFPLTKGTNYRTWLFTLGNWV